MSRSLLERLKSVKESAEAAGIRGEQGFNVVQLYLSDLDKILAVLEAAIVVDNSIYITPNNGKGAAQWEILSNAINEMKDEE